MTEEGIRIQVACYAGYRGEETPRRIFLQKRQIDVVEITDRWLAPDHRYFKLLGSDEATYIIRHDTAADHWELTLYSSPVPKPPSALTSRS